MRPSGSRCNRAGAGADERDELRAAALAARERAARSLQRFLSRAAAVTPRAGHEERNREALRLQARSVLIGELRG
jgi:hypothetical protein